MAKWYAQGDRKYVRCCSCKNFIQEDSLENLDLNGRVILNDSKRSRFCWCWMQLAWVAVSCEQDDRDLSFVRDEFSVTFLRKASCFIYLIVFYIALMTGQPK